MPASVRAISCCVLSRAKYSRCSMLSRYRSTAAKENWKDMVSWEEQTIALSSMPVALAHLVVAGEICRFEVRLPEPYPAWHPCPADMRRCGPGLLPGHRPPAAS